MALAVGACGSVTEHSQADPATPFDIKSNMALVVVGTRATGTAYEETWGSTQDFVPAVTMEWRLQSQETHAFRATATGKTYRRPTEYDVFLLPPGTYLLIGIETSVGRQIKITEMAVGREGLAVDVRPGEIAYIGNFDVDTAKFPARITRYSRDDPAALAALKRFPNVKASVRYVKPYALALTSG